MELAVVMVEILHCPSTDVANHLGQSDGSQLHLVEHSCIYHTDTWGERDTSSTTLTQRERCIYMLSSPISCRVRSIMKVHVYMYIVYVVVVVVMDTW